MSQDDLVDFERLGNLSLTCLGDDASPFVVDFAWKCEDRVLFVEVDLSPTAFYEETVEHARIQELGELVAPAALTLIRFNPKPVKGCVKQISLRDMLFDEIRHFKAVGGGAGAAAENYHDATGVRLIHIDTRGRREEHIALEKSGSTHRDKRARA